MVRTYSQLLLVCLLVPTFAQQVPEVSFPVNITRARVDVRVGHRHAADSVEGLRASDFTISENGREMEVKSVDRESVPLDLILMLDVSDSMNRVADELMNAASELTASFKPEDRVAVVEYAGAPVVRTGFTSDAAKITEAL